MSKDSVAVWKKRVEAAKDLHKKWMSEQRVQECYNYWRGDQLVEPFDEFGRRRAQINKIHPEVRNNIPAIYYYHPFARITAAPEALDDPGTTVEQDIQLLQDTTNHLMRDPRTMYRDSTYIALKESHWALGLVEVGYTAEFTEAPNVETKPPLKEKKDTKVGKPLPPEEPQAPILDPAAAPFPSLTGTDPLAAPPPNPLDPSAVMEPMGIAAPIEAPPQPPDLTEMLSQIDMLKSSIQDEKFFVRHIPANQVLVSISDLPILESNDWVWYWEDLPLEDVKRSDAYKNKDDLKPNTGDPDKERSEEIGRAHV
jgi:hypothetical protein